MFQVPVKRFTSIGSGHGQILPLFNGPQKRWELAAILCRVVSFQVFHKFMGLGRIKTYIKD